MKYSTSQAIKEFVESVRRSGAASDEATKKVLSALDRDPSLLDAAAGVAKLILLWLAIWLLATRVNWEVVLKP